MIHTRKCWLDAFADLVTGAKVADIRRDDREDTFTAGDTLVLREWDWRSGYTGRRLERTVTHVERRREFVPSGHVVLSLAEPHAITRELQGTVIRELMPYLEPDETPVDGLRRLLAAHAAVAAASGHDVQDDLGVAGA